MKSRQFPKALKSLVENSEFLCYTGYTRNKLNPAGGSPMYQSAISIKHSNRSHLYWGIDKATGEVVGIDDVS